MSTATHCKACGEEIFLLDVAAGKYLTCNVWAAQENRTPIRDINGEAHLVAPHWKTCTQADQINSGGKIEPSGMTYDEIMKLLKACRMAVQYGCPEVPGVARLHTKLAIQAIKDCQFHLTEQQYALNLKSKQED